MFFFYAMVHIFSFGERWNVLFNLALPNGIEHSISHLMKISSPSHFKPFIILSVKSYSPYLASPDSKWHKVIAPPPELWPKPPCVTWESLHYKLIIDYNICINVCIIKIHVPRAHEVKNQRVIIIIIN